jgi:uncharacterized protein YndB with AHSA1/START domain
MDYESPMTDLRIDRAERVIAADAGAIFTALTDADAVAAWMPPGDASGEIHAFEPRPGGAFRMTLHFRSGNAANGKTTASSDTVDAQFIRVERDRLVELAVRFVADDPAYAGTMRMIWMLDRCGPQQTKVTVEASDVPEGISAKDHADGLEASLENLQKWCAGSL